MAKGQTSMKREKLTALIAAGNEVQQNHKNAVQRMSSSGIVYVGGVGKGTEGFDKWIGDVKTASARYFSDHPLSEDLSTALFHKRYKEVMGLLESMGNDEEYLCAETYKASAQRDNQPLASGLPKNSHELLIALVESNNPANLLSEKFKQLSLREDDELRSILRELKEEGFIERIKWADNLPFFVSLNNKARTYASNSKLGNADTVAGFIKVTPVAINNNRITIDIRPEIYEHIRSYLQNEDYFHAVEESFKLVRELLRKLTDSVQAHKAFAEENYSKVFGHSPSSEQEKDFFEGVKYLNMAIQKFRNEKAHTPANPLDQNLALHYVILASLAYDLISREGIEGSDAV
jgi:uncharacterized protein (TIGR02391 family)